MARFRLLLIALLSTILQVAAAPAPDSIAWKRVALPAGASIELPASLTAMPVSDAGTQVYFANTSGATYVAVCAVIDSASYPYSKSRLTPDELATVYEANIKSLIGDETRAKVLRRTPFELAGQQGVDVEFDLPATASLGGTKFARIIYASHRAYMLTWRATLANPASDGAASRARFFNSLQVKAAPAAESEASNPRQTGRTMGRLLVYAAVIVLIIMLVRRSRAAKKGGVQP
ncbi:hypothetical protein [Hymenobacter arcticus]